MDLTLHAYEANEVRQLSRTEWFGESIRRFERCGDITDINGTLFQNASLIMELDIKVLGAFVKLRIVRESNGGLIIGHNVCDG